MNSIEFAIKMEKDGAKYYSEQAEKNKGNSVYAVFISLAKDEKNHAAILQNKNSGLTYKLQDNDTLTKSENIFKGIGDFKNEIREIPKQIDLYRVALEMEKKSIDLYNNFLSETLDDKEKELFIYLVKQEEEHYIIIEQLVYLINRPDEWVESAEFGIRKEY